jgi:hypothetical protein
LKTCVFRGKNKQNRRRKKLEAAEKALDITPIKYPAKSGMFRKSHQNHLFYDILLFLWPGRRENAENRG